MTSLLLLFLLCPFAAAVVVAQPLVIPGTGASLPASAYTSWITQYASSFNGISQDQLLLQYNAKSSGAGQLAIADQVLNSTTRDVNGVPVWFIGSDLPLTSPGAADVPDLQIVPVIAAAVVVVYNLPALHQSFQLTMSLDVLAKIYLGNVTQWDDPEIVALNPDIAALLPPANITVIARSDSSGTTYTLTRALSSVNADFARIVGVRSVMPSPLSFSPPLPANYSFIVPPNNIPGSLAIAFAADDGISYPNSIGYVEQTYADQYFVTYATLLNAHGDLVTPNITSINITLNEFGLSIFPNTTYFWGSVANPQSPWAYPLAAYSYWVFYRTSMPSYAIAYNLIRFLYWTQTYSPAANSAEVLGFLLPPQPVRNLVVTVLANVTFEGTPVLPDVISSLLCPPGTQRVNNADLSYTCSACAIGFFNLVANGSCTPCPSGALCPGGTAIYADQYYWRTPPQDASDASDPFLLDPPFTYCGINSACCTEGNFTSLIGCAIEDGCGPNYNSSSKLCSECNAGFYSWGGECLECDQSYYSVIIAGTYVASIAFIVFLLVIPKWRSNFLTDMIFFFQIANMLVGPAISQAFMGIINLNIDSLVNGSSHCLAPLSPVNKFLIVYLYPCILVGNLLLIFVLCYGWHGLRIAYPDLNTIHNFLPGWIKDRPLRTQLAAGFVEVAMICYLPLVRPSLQVFDCITVPGFDGSYMRSVPTTECYVGEHLGLIAISVVILAIACVFVPIYIFVVINKRAHKRLLNWNDWQDEYGIFYQQFKPLSFFYYSVDLLERIVILVLSVAFAGSDLWLGIALFLGLWCILFMRIYVRPYRQWLDNVLKITTLMCASGLALICAINATDVMSTSWSSLTGIVAFFVYLPLFILPFKLYFIGLFAYRMWNTVQLKHRAQHLPSGPALVRAQTKLALVNERQRKTSYVNLDDSLPHRIARLFQEPIYVSGHQFMDMVQSDELRPPSPAHRPLSSPSDAPASATGSPSKINSYAVGSSTTSLSVSSSPEPLAHRGRPGRRESVVVPIEEGHSSSHQQAQRDSAIIIPIEMEELTLPPPIIVSDS